MSEMKTAAWHQEEAERLLVVAKAGTNLITGQTMNTASLQAEQQQIANLVAMAHVHALLARR